MNLVDYFPRPVEVSPISLDAPVLGRRRDSMDAGELTPRDTRQDTGKKALPVLLVQLNAVVTQPIAAIAEPSLVLRDVATRWACTIIVMNTIGGRLLGFVDRMKCWRSWHWSLPVVVVDIARVCRRRAGKRH